MSTFVWTLIFVTSIVLFSWTAHKTMTARRQAITGDEGGQASESTTKAH
jgi:hypothetical protein